MFANYSNVDRRASSRARTNLPMTAYVDGIPRSYRAIDVSCSGALVERSALRSPPTIHHIELDLGGEKPLKMVARTVWTEGMHHAVRFIGMADADRLEIAELLDRLHHRL